MKKLSYSRLVLNSALLFTSTVLAAASETKSPDPSDLTEVSTSGYIGMANSGDVKMSGSAGFTLSNGQMAMTTIEGTMDRSGDYKDARWQYFHVFEFGEKVVPRAAFSVDVIDNQQLTTAALGGIALVDIASDSLSLFIRGGVMTGEYDKEFAASLGANDFQVNGGMGAAYLVWKTGSDGSYTMISPEFTLTDGQVSSSILKSTLLFATPISNDKSKWGQLKIENTKGRFDSNKSHIDVRDTVAWAQFRVYF